MTGVAGVGQVGKKVADVLGERVRLPGLTDHRVDRRHHSALRRGCQITGKRTGRVAATFLTEESVYDAAEPRSEIAASVAFAADGAVGHSLSAAWGLKILAG